MVLNPSDFLSCVIWGTSPQWKQDRALQRTVSFWKCYSVHTSLFQQAARALEKTKATAGTNMLLIKTPAWCSPGACPDFAVWSPGCSWHIWGEPGADPQAGGDTLLPPCRLWQLQSAFHWPGAPTAPQLMLWTSSRWVACLKLGLAGLCRFSGLTQLYLFILSHSWGWQLEITAWVLSTFSLRWRIKISILP